MPGKLPDSIKSFQINISDAAEKRPVLAIEAARIFSWWATVEFVLEQMATVLIGEPLALSLLDQQRSRNQKLDGIRTAVEIKVERREVRALLKPLFVLINKAAAPRNQLAHCLWGTIEDLPDALLLTEPHAMVKAGRMINDLAVDRQTSSKGPGHVGMEHSFEDATKFEQTRAVVALMRDSTEVWRQADFDVPRLLLHRSVIGLTQFMVAATGAGPAVEEGTGQLKAMLRETAETYY